MSRLSLPDGVLLTYYGDDFTGSSAVMEVMSFAGLESVMFLAMPSAAQLARFGHCRCIGIAGTSRAKDPTWMARELSAQFAALATLKAPITHYKVCSTFDSAPHIGSIGKAIDVGHAVFPARWVPIVVGAPAMARYQVFGTLFAGVNGVTHRIDRHPTMAHHPVTPMDEADLCRHLSRQTDRRIGLIEYSSIKAGAADARLAELQGPDGPAVFIDVCDDDTLCAAGRLIWENRTTGPFIAGSQGVEYALVAYWRQKGLVAPQGLPVKRPAVDKIAVVSGSCSPVTATQIAHAVAQGFGDIPLEACKAVDPVAWEHEIGRARDQALTMLGEGISPVIYTACGPQDCAVTRLMQAIKTSGQAASSVNARIGAGLGTILAALIEGAGVRRAVVAGGDTSGEATTALGVYALSASAFMAPGAPLCTAYSDNPVMDGIELALKGGQIGGVDYFSIVRNGGPYQGYA